MHQKPYDTTSGLPKSSHDKNQFKQVTNEIPVCQVCEKVGCNTQSCFVLRDLLTGKGGSPLAIVAQHNNEEVMENCASCNSSCSRLLDAGLTTI